MQEHFTICDVGVHMKEVAGPYEPIKAVNGVVGVTTCVKAFAL